MTDTSRVLIVGASLAGVHAAVGLRQAGFRGALTILGAEPHEPYDRPPLSKRMLERADAPVRLPAAAGIDAEWLLGRRAIGLDPAARTVSLDDGRTLAYDGLVIATGAAAIVPRWAAGDDPRGPADARQGPASGAVHVVRTLEDAERLRRALEDASGTGGRVPRVVVVGAGFVGAEVAAACRVRGAEVTVVDPLELPLLRACGPLIGSVLAREHRARGVHLRLGHSVRAVTAPTAPEDSGRPGGARVTLSTGEVLDADVVVLGLGARPATGWLHGSGLDVSDGVRCDATCRAAPGIVAAGDVCRWPSGLFGTELRVEHWTNAVEQGEYAGARLHAELTGGAPPEPFDPVPYLWSEQFGHQVQVFGCPAPGDDIHLLDGAVDSGRFVGAHVRGGLVRAVVGMDWPARVRRYRALVAQASPWRDVRPAATPVGASQ